MSELRHNGNIYQIAAARIVNRETLVEIPIPTVIEYSSSDNDSEEVVYSFAALSSSFTFQLDEHSAWALVHLMTVHWYYRWLKPLRTAN